MLLSKAYEQDPTPSSILKALDRGDPRYKDITLIEYQRRRNLLYYRDRLYIPNYDELKV